MPSALCFLALASLAASPSLPSAALPGASPAADIPTDAPLVRALDFNWTRDGILTGVSGALWIGSEVMKSRLAPRECRWCDRASDGRDTLNPVDRWGRGLAASTEGGRRTWNTASNVVGFGVLPVGVLGAQYLLAAGSGASGRMHAEDAVTIVESVALGALTNQVVKFAVGRERPFVHVLEDGQKGLTDQPSDNNLSFYSGHTSLAFSLVTAAGTVSELRGYRNSWLIWAVGLPAAASMGLIRMGADKHYLTDVLVGAAAGSLFGVGVPLLLHRPSGSEPAAASSIPVQMTGGLGGFALSGQF